MRYFFVLVAFLAVGGLAWFNGNLTGVQEGLARCEKCARFEPGEKLSEILVPAAKLVLVQRSARLKNDFQLMPKGALKEWLADKLKWAIADSAKGSFIYQASFQYGLDLADQKQWRIAVKEGNRIEFDAPPIVLIGCPSINLGSLIVEMNQKSVFVDDQHEVPQEQRNLTSLALREGERHLLDNALRATIKSEMEKQLRPLLAGLAHALGLAVKEADIHINYARESDAQAWPEKGDEIPARLKRAGCA
jgi:hypothetical protein